MQVPVVGDLVTARDDGRHRIRMMICRVPGHIEGARDAAGGQQVKDAAQATLGTEPPLRQHCQSPAVLGTLAEPGRLCVHVEGQRDGHVGAAWPAGEFCLREHEGGSYLGVTGGEASALALNRSGGSSGTGGPVIGGPVTCGPVTGGSTTGAPPGGPWRPRLPALRSTSQVIAAITNNSRYT